MSAKQIFIILILLASFQVEFGQNNELPKLLPNGKVILDFVPKDWKIAQQIEGDLNGDNLADTILVLQGADQKLVKQPESFDFNVIVKDEKTGKIKLLIDNNPVILAVLSKNENGYQLIAKNNQLISPFFSNNSYCQKYSVSLENKILQVALNSRVCDLMDVFGEETKTFRFQIQNSRLVLVEAQKITWSDAVFSGYGRGNGRRDFFEKYDFLKNKNYLTYTNRTNNEAVQETLVKVNELISFDLVPNSFSELEQIANYKVDEKKDANKDALIKIPYGVKKMLFGYRTDFDEKEKEKVETEIRGQAKFIRQLKETNEFKCVEDSFQIIDFANGRFIKTAEKDAPLKGVGVGQGLGTSKIKPNPSQRDFMQKPQNAYLYHLCSMGKAQYATNLGGIVITEKGKIKAHYIFSNVSGFDGINVLPDVNENGLSELVLEFSHSINSLDFARAIGIFEVDAKNKLINLGETDVFRRLENQEYDDIFYAIFVKKGKKPEFYRETFASESQKNEWAKIEGLLKTNLNNPTISLTALPVYKAPIFTTEEISRRVIGLIKNIKTVSDISPKNVENSNGGKLSFDKKEPDSFGYAGKIAKTDWFYQIFSVTRKNDTAKRLEFSFENEDDKEDDLQPLCSFSYEDYKKHLVDEGFTVKPIYGEHGRLLYWQFDKNFVEVKLSTYKYKKNECVKSLWINAFK